MTLAFTVMAYSTGVSIAFDPQPAIVAALKHSFPAAVWRPVERFWWIDGASMEYPVYAWVRRQSRGPEAGARQAGPDTPGVCTATPHGIEVRTPYDPRIVARLRSIPGATWNAAARAWIVPPGEAGALRAALSGIEAGAGEPGQPKPALPRFPVLLANLPTLGVPLRRGPDLIVVERLGRPFFVSADVQAAWRELGGHHGKRCCYAYFRPASRAEQAAMNDMIPSR